MSWFARKSQKSRLTGNPKRVAVPQLAPLQVWGSASRTAVGSQYNPATYRRLKQGTEVQVTLLAQPGNEHDSNAVLVMLNGQLCGYLGHSTAEWFQPLVLMAAKQGHFLWTLGRVDHIKGEATIRMALPNERELRILLGLAVPPEPARGKLKRLGKSEDLIHRILDGRDGVVVPVILTTEATPSGKYAGQTMIRATLDGQTLGLIPAQYRDECPELFTLVEAAPRSAEADIRIYEYGPWIRVTVTPSV